MLVLLHLLELRIELAHTAAQQRKEAMSTKKGGASRVSCVFTVVLLNVPNAIKDKP